MANKKSKKRTFNNMSYHEVQRANSENRTGLPKEQQKWLKQNRYKNVGWDNVISLYQKIFDFLDQNKLEEFTLEDLFLEADRIGNKYLSIQEREEFNQKLTKEISEIEEEIDKQFPDTEIEVVDFSEKINYKSRRNVK
jgi:hypothetical protein